MYELGIDLGTTYTAAAVRRGERVDIAPLRAHGPVIPSVVLLGDGPVLAGEAAQRRALTDPAHVAREFKRRIGDPLPVIVAGEPHSAESLSARLLKAVVNAVAGLEGEAPRRVALTHPANWGAYKKDLYEQAVRFADLPDVVYLTEPEAAAIHYASQERVDDGSVVAVYDLGGGTFDATVLRKAGESFEVLGQPEGIERLGGIDFDQAVFSHVCSALELDVDALDRTDAAVLAGMARLRQDCIEAKEALSSDTEASIPVALPGLHTEVRITRPELETMLRRAIADTVSALRRAFRDAAVEPGELSTVLLVGGSSRIPMVAEMVTADLGRPVAVDAHPKYAIAMGAARFAGLAAPAAVGASARVSAAAPAAAAAPAPVEVAASSIAVAAPPTPPAPPPPPPPIPAPEPAPLVTELEPAAAPAAVAVAAPVAAPPPEVAAPSPPIAAPTPAPAPAPPTPRPEPVTSPGGGGGGRSPFAKPAVRFGVAAAVVAVLAAGAAVALGGGGGGGGGNEDDADVAAADPAAADDGCPGEGPFICLQSASNDDGTLSARFDTIGVVLGQDATASFFLSSQPSSVVQWDVPDPFESSVGGEVPSDAQLCALLNGNSGAVQGTGNCVDIE